MAQADLGAFVYPPDKVERPKSVEDGLTLDVERRLRSFGTELIERAGILLRLPQATMGTAQVLFHRFYVHSSFRDFDVRHVSMSSILLATKAKETPRKARDICNVFHRIQLRDNNLPISTMDVGGDEYWKMKNAMINTEQHMLRHLGYVVEVTLPHKYLINYAKVLDGKEEFVQKAWNYANDSLRTPMCIKYRPENLASAAIYLASKSLDIPLPVAPTPWWILFDTSTEVLLEIGTAIMKLYDQPKPVYLPVLRSSQPLPVRK